MGRRVCVRAANLEMAMLFESQPTEAEDLPGVSQRNEWFTVVLRLLHLLEISYGQPWYGPQAFQYEPYWCSCGALACGQWPTQGGDAVATSAAVYSSDGGHSDLRAAAVQTEEMTEEEQLEKDPREQPMDSDTAASAGALTLLAEPGQCLGVHFERQTLPTQPRKTASAAQPSGTASPTPVATPVAAKKRGKKKKKDRGHSTDEDEMALEAGMALSRTEERLMLKEEQAAKERLAAVSAAVPSEDGCSSLPPQPLDDTPGAEPGQPRETPSPPAQPSVVELELEVQACKSQIALTEAEVRKSQVEIAVAEKRAQEKQRELARERRVLEQLSR